MAQLIGTFVSTKQNQNQKNLKIMNTNETLARLSTMFTSEDNLMTFIDLIDDLDLELKNIVMA